jgi:hypothetical protein
MRHLKLWLMTFSFTLCAYAAAPSAFTPFAGQWQGVLEYQDYQSPARIKIPVTLEVIPSSVSQAAWNFDYDDFGRTVLSLETHTWLDGTYRVTTEGESEIQVYQSDDFAALLERGSGQAVLFGSEMDNGKTVRIRRTITLEPNSLVTLKEVETEKDTFSFRNQSTYSRVE